MKLGKKLPIAIVLVSLLMITMTMFQVNDNDNYVPTITEEKLSTSDIPPIRTTEPPREETVWMVGAYTTPDEFLPWSESMHPGTDCMYEALFGWNAEKEELIPCIGTSYSWSSDGSELTIELNTDAEWTDGEALDADDVVYSYELAQAQPQYTANFEARFEDFNKVDADTVRFDINTGYYNSRQVFTWIAGGIPIVPEHVWTEIVAEHGTDVVGDVGELSTYQNDWFDSDDVPDEWKVISGPYAPVYRDALETTCAYQYRGDEWWGEGIIYQDIPNADKEPPKYIGHTAFATNTEQDLAFIQGDVDLYAGYYLNIWEIWEDAEEGDPGSYISCWYGHDAPYQLAVSGLMNLAPNHLLADSPLGVKEFRQALAWAINYAPIPAAAASGYWTRAKPGFIDNNSAAHAPYYDASVTTTYQKSEDVAKAVALLESIPGMTGSVATGWTYNGVAVGPYESIVPNGWSDAIIFQEMVCADITDNLGITITSTQVEFATLWIPAIENNDYDFTTYCVGAAILEPPHVFLDSLVGRHSTWNNATNWDSIEADEFEAKWQTLESANETLYADNLDRLQEILAEEVPEIPGFVNGYWYAFSEYHWEGFTSEANKFQEIVTTWTANKFALKTRLMLNLKSRDPESPMITINSPSENQLYGESAPSFNVEIYESYLDTMWYTIDGGLTNITFITNGTIDQNNWSAHDDGPVTIIFYANDTLGHINSTQVIINKDTTLPVINIISPLPDQLFGANSPDFTVGIYEPNLDTMWYTIDGGLTNITFTTNGTIDQNNWSVHADGLVTIIFCANDSLGHMNSAQVIINKEITGRGVIPGYSLYFLICSLGIVSIILVRKLYVKMIKD